MAVLSVILGIVAAVLLFLFIMQKREINSISAQLDSLLKQDTNGLVHSQNGGKDCAELIDKINTLLKGMRQSKMHYRQKSHELEQMMTNISHDLRTPLTSAMGYIDIIRHSDLPQEEKEREIMIVEQRLIRLEELLNSFFEFSKIISGDKQPEREQLNLVEVLQESIVHYFDDYCAQNREIRLEGNKSKLKIMSNRTVLMRIFDNLIGNAYKHGAGNLSVIVSDSDGVKIRFENEYVDSDLEIDRVFDEFYTTDISRTKGNTGLGLAIAKQFTEMLGGKIAAEYDGERFSVTVEFSVIERL